MVPFSRRRRLARSFARIAAISFISSRRRILVQLIHNLLTRAMRGAMFRLGAVISQLVTRRRVLMKVILVRLCGFSAAFVLFARCEMDRALYNRNLASAKHALRSSIFLILRGHSGNVVLALNRMSFIRRYYLVMFLSFINCRRQVFLASRVGSRVMLTLNGSRGATLLRHRVLRFNGFKTFLRNHGVGKE